MVQMKRVGTNRILVVLNGDLACSHEVKKTFETKSNGDLTLISLEDVCPQNWAKKNNFAS